MATCRRRSIPTGLAALVAIEPKPDAIRRLAAVLDDGANAAARLRLSNADRDRLLALTGQNPVDPAADTRAQRVLLYRRGAPLYRDFALLQGAPQLLALGDAWANPTLPVGGGDAKALGHCGRSRRGRPFAPGRELVDRERFSGRPGGLPRPHAGAGQPALILTRRA